MYLQKTPVYYPYSGEAFIQRGNFLLLLSERGRAFGPDNCYAIVRKVALRQFGPWMMGRANLGGKWVVVSGSYGADGLVKDVDALPVDAIPLPLELYNAWSKGGGHNSAGSEAAAMRQWAIETFLKRE